MFIISFLYFRAPITRVSDLVVFVVCCSLCEAKERPTVDWKIGNTVTTTLLLVKVFLLSRSTQLNYITECLKTFDRSLVLNI